MSKIGPIRFAAFNIQIFGDSKIENEFCLDYLVKIISKFDLIAVQEIRDSNGDAFPKFINALNQKDNIYDFAVGDRQGRTSSKVQASLRVLIILVLRSNME